MQENNCSHRRQRRLAPVSELQRAMVLSALCLLLAVVLLLNGCGFLKKDLPAPPPLLPAQIPLNVALTLLSTADSNPDTRGNPSPIRVRVFLTDAATEFTEDAFESVFEFNGAAPPAKPAMTLMLQPGATRVLTISGNRSQSQVVIAAAFRDLYSAKWLARKTIDTRNPGTITATINSASVEIQ